MTQPLLKVHTIGLKELGRDTKIHALKKNKYINRGLKKGCMLVIAHAKKTYLRKTAGSKDETRLGTTGGGLKKNLTHRVNEKAGTAKVGWWSNKYAHVVAEPPKGKTETTIRPKVKSLLFFPLSRRARSAWASRPIGGKPEDWRAFRAQFKPGRDFAFAKQVTIKARFPLSRALHDKRKQVTEIFLKEIKTIERK